MHRLLRDTIVAVAGGVVVSLIITFTTSLGEGLLVLVWIGVLAACGLILAAPQLPRHIRQRRQKFTTEVIAAARAVILAELTLPAAEPDRADVPAEVIAAAQDSTRADEMAEFGGLLAEGRDLQAKLFNVDTSDGHLSSHKAVSLAEWEGKVCTSLVTFPDYLRLFKVVMFASDLFDISTRSAKYRMDSGFGVIEELMLSLHNKSQGADYKKVTS